MFSVYTCMNDVSNMLKEVTLKMHKCNKEDDITEIKVKIAEISVIVKDLKKALMGNGQIGMIKKFAQWEGVMKFMAFFMLVFGGSLVALVMRVYFNQ